MTDPITIGVGLIAMVLGALIGVVMTGGNTPEVRRARQEGYLAGVRDAAAKRRKGPRHG